MWIARHLSQKSLPEIGRAFGRDHTTVLHAIRRAGAIAALVGAPESETAEAWAARLWAADWRRVKGDPTALLPV